MDEKGADRVPATQSRTWVRPVHAAILLGVLVTLGFCRWIPHNFASFLLSDSGIFLYVGQQLSEGLGLYSEVWDHKPPLIFLLNEFALRAAGGSLVGPLLLDYVFFLGFILLTWRILYRSFGLFPALSGTLLVLFTAPRLFGTPNLVEVYAILFQAISLFCYDWDSSLSEPGYLKRWLPVLQGVLAVFLFQLRPNLMGMPFLYLAATTWTSLRRSDWTAGGRRIVLFSGAFLVGNVAFVLPFWAHGTLAQYLDATLGFNLAYSSLGNSFGARVNVICQGLLITGHQGIGLLAVVALATYFFSRSFWSGPQFRLTRFAALLLTIECVLSAVSGKPFEHYYGTWLLPMALIAASWIKSVGDAAASYSATAFTRVVQVACVAVAVGIVAESVGAIRFNLTKARYPTANVVEFLKKESAPSDRVLIWGSSYRQVWFRLDRRPASRFFCTTPLTHGKELYRRLAPELLHDLDVRRPRYVLETQQYNLPCLFAETCDSRSTETYDDAAMHELKHSLSLRYSVVMQEAGPAHMTVYRLNPKFQPASGPESTSGLP